MKSSDSGYEYNTQERIGFAEEFTAALEAADGSCPAGTFSDPMDDAAVLEGFNRVLTSKRPDWGLQVLARTGVIAQVLPEVAAMIGFGDGIRHKDVWIHTCQVVRQAPPRLLCRWGALLHDIGKVPTRRFTPEGQVTFIGHPEIGARMFEKMAKRLPFPPDARDSIRFLIAAHLRGSAYQESWTDSAVRRFAKDTGTNLVDLLDVARADITSKYEEKVRRGLRQINLLAERIQRVTEADAKPAPLPKGLGGLLMTELGVAPGPGLGRLMDMLGQKVEEGVLAAQAPAEMYIQYLRDNPDLWSER